MYTHVHGYLDILIFGYLDIWISGCSDIWMFGYLDIWISGYLDIWIHYLDFGNSGFGDIRILVKNNLFFHPDSEILCGAALPAAHFCRKNSFLMFCKLKLCFFDST